MAPHSNDPVEQERLDGGSARASQNLQHGAWSTPTIDRLIDTCRNLVVEITRDDYFSRGTFAAASHNFVIMASEDVVSPLKSELASRLAFLNSSIDSGVKSGVLPAAQAALLKQRAEIQVFQLRPPANLHFSDGFLKFYEHHSQVMHQEAMAQVRKILQAQAVTGIDEKLRAVQPTVGAHDSKPTSSQTELNPAAAAAPRSRFQAGFDTARQLLNGAPPVRSPHMESAPAASTPHEVTHGELDLDEVGYDGGPRPGM